MMYCPVVFMLFVFCCIFRCYRVSYMHKWYVGLRQTN